MKKETYTKCMGFLQLTFGEIDKQKIGFYWDTLKEIEDKKFEEITKKLVFNYIPTSTCPFPVPAHFYKQAGYDNETKTQELISMVRMAVRKHGSYMSIDFGCLALHAVIERWGGWPQICDWGVEDWAINEGKFRDAIESSLLVGDHGPNYVKGLFEKENGFLNPHNLIKLVKVNGKIIEIENNLVNEKLLTGKV